MLRSMMLLASWAIILACHVDIGGRATEPAGWANRA